MKFVGRLHDVSGVDPRFLDVTGLAFCHALDQLDHGDIWNCQVKDTWQTFFRVIVRTMKKGYATTGHGVMFKNNLVLFSEQKSLITEVRFSWLTTAVTRVSHKLNDWVDGLSDEAYYPWESPKRIRLKSVNPTFASEQKKVSIYQ